MGNYIICAMFTRITRLLYVEDNLYKQEDMLLCARALIITDISLWPVKWNILVHQHCQEYLIWTQLVMNNGQYHIFDALVLRQLTSKHDIIIVL